MLAERLPRCSVDALSSLRLPAALPPSCRRLQFQKPKKKKERKLKKKALTEEELAALEAEAAARGTCGTAL